MSLARDLADRIVGVAFEDLPDEAVQASKNAALDTIGVILAGALSGPTKAVAAASGIDRSGGPCLVMGGGYRTNMLDAAMINGTASHALDFDDCNNTLGGHPTVPILPGLWAYGETMGASGRQIVEAYVIGVETECKFAQAVNFHHYEKGWHPTATLGIFGAAAANSRLAGLDADKTATALAIAASMASGLKANFGTFTKPYHVGHCTRNGLMAVRLAAEGLTANHDVFEHHQGYLEVYNGAGTYDISRALLGWADPYDVVEPGIAVKMHPCCASTHPAIDAMIHMRKEHGLTLDNVKSVRSWTHPRRLKHTNRPTPKTGFDGKFSVQYVVTRALQNGAISLNDFSDERVNEPIIQKFLAEKMLAEPHPQTRNDVKNVYFAELTVETTDGRTLTHYVDAPVGRDRHHPLPDGALVAKFRDCASQILDKSAIADVERMLLDLDAITDINEVSRRIEAGERPPGQRLASVA